MITTYSNVNINDCTFNDILSFNDGGAFNFHNNDSVKGLNLNFNNVTSLGKVLTNMLNYIYKTICV